MWLPGALHFERLPLRGSASIKGKPWCFRFVSAVRPFPRHTAFLSSPTLALSMVSWLPTLSTLILVLRVGGRAPISFFQVAFIAVKGAQAACSFAVHGAPGPVVCSLLGHHGVQAVCRHRFLLHCFYTAFLFCGLLLLGPQSGVHHQCATATRFSRPHSLPSLVFQVFRRPVVAIVFANLKGVPVLLRWC